VTTLGGYLRFTNWSAFAFALSAVVLGYSLQVSNGFYNETALRWLSGALVLCIGATLAQRANPSLAPRSEQMLSYLLLAGILFQVYLLFTALPGMYIERHVSFVPFYLLLLAQGGLAIVGAARLRQAQQLWFPLALAAALGIGVWMIKASPRPYIDVVVVHKEALDALLQDKDPYRISFENVYAKEDVHNFYNPSAIIGNRVAFGYPYPPASLLLVVPGYWLFGDYRYSELALLVGAAALIGFTQRTRAAKLAACLLLTTPRVWFVIEQGWTEPVPLFALALTVFFVARHPILAGWAAGLMVVTKQYLGFCGLAVLRLMLLRPRQWLWVGLSVVAAACIVTLPLALWHPNAFMRNVVWLQTQEPFRMDSLSYLSWAARHGYGQGTFMWAVGSAVAAAVIGIIATHNTPAGFASSVTLTTFLMFAFGSKAFCNYYFFVLGALCVTLAAYPSTEEPAVASP
jgi:hypothetical protein